MAANKFKFFLSASALAGSMGINMAQAAEIDTNIAKLQAMDKITGMVRVINVPVNSEVKYGSFSIVVRACKTRPPEETPENFAFVDVVDNYKSENPVNIFRGWMVSSSPSLNPVEHPIYDIWLLSCENGVVNPNLKIMTQEELKAREQIPQAQQVSQVQNPDAIPEQLLNQNSENSANLPVAETANMGDISKSADNAKVVSANADNADQQINEAQDMRGDGVPQALVNIGNENTEAFDDVDDESVTRETVSSPVTIQPQTLPEEASAEEAASNVVLPQSSDEKTLSQGGAKALETPSAMASTPQNIGNVQDMENAYSEQSMEAIGEAEPIAATDIELPAEDMLPVEEIEENGMLDDQLIDFSE